MIAHHNNLRAQMLKKAHVGRCLLGMVDRFISCAELTASWVAARKVFHSVVSVIHSGNLKTCTASSGRAWDGYL